MAKFIKLGAYGQAFFDLRCKTEHGTVRGTLSRSYTWQKWDVQVQKHNCRTLALAEGILIAAAVRAAAKISADEAFAESVKKLAEEPVTE